MNVRETTVNQTHDWPGTSVGLAHGSLSLVFHSAFTINDVASQRKPSFLQVDVF